MMPAYTWTLDSVRDTAARLWHFGFQAYESPNAEPNKRCTLLRERMGRRTYYVGPDWATVADLAALPAERYVQEASDALNAIPGVGSGQYGLTPDHVRQSPAYRAAKATYDDAWRTLRQANTKRLATTPTP